MKDMEKQTSCTSVIDKPSLAFHDKSHYMSAIVVLECTVKKRCHMVPSCLRVACLCDSCLYITVTKHGTGITHG